MADTPVSAVGDVAQSGAKVVASNSVQTNDQHTVGTNPDAGRLTLVAPDGYRYTAVASSSVGSTTLLREPK